MHKTKLTILPILLILISLVLASCGLAPVEVETAPEAEVGLDGEWKSDETPPYRYAQAMRDRLDPVLDEVFGIGQVHYYTLDTLETYNVRYVLEETPQGEAFYYALEDVFDRAFHDYLFADHPTAESYFEWNDELPEDMSVVLMFEGMNHYWIVMYDGTYLTFTTV